MQAQYLAQSVVCRNLVIVYVTPCSVFICSMPQFIVCPSTCKDSDLLSSAMLHKHGRIPVCEHKCIIISRDVISSDVDVVLVMSRYRCKFGSKCMHKVKAFKEV